MSLTTRPSCSGMVVPQVTEGSFTQGELIMCIVQKVYPIHAVVTARGGIGVVRGSAAGRLSVGQHVRVRIVEVNEGGRAFVGAVVGGG